MSAQTEPEGVTSVDRADNQFEDWAQSLSEFVIRTVVLPVTLLMTKPSAIAQGSVMRRYRPLPSPFLLAVVMGIVISGVVAAVITAVATSGGGAAQAPAQPATADATNEQAQRVAGFGQRVFDALAQFYSDADGMRAVLLALPFVAFIWIAAGLTSATMFRGMKNVNAMFAGFSLSISAIIEVAAIGAAVGLVLPPGFLFESAPWLGSAFAIFALIISLKVLRLIFFLRKEHRSSWFGALLSIPLAFLVMLAAASAGGGTAFALLASHGDEPFTRGDAAMTSHQYDEAIQAYSDGIRYRPNYDDGLNRRAGAALAAGYLDQALADANAAIAMWEGRYGGSRAPVNYYTTRAEVLSARGDHAGAESEFTAALEETDYAFLRIGVLAGRCRARAAWGEEHLADALEDCNAAIALNEYTWQAREARGIVHLMLRQKDAAMEDFRYASQSSPFSRYGFGLLQIEHGEQEAGEENAVAAFNADMSVSSRWNAFDQYLEAPAQEAAPAN